jgi:hypothetical protein
VDSEAGRRGRRRRRRRRRRRGKKEVFNDTLEGRWWSD